MGIFDWFRNKASPVEKNQTEIEELLPESLDRDSLIEDTLSIFEEEDDELAVEDIVEPRPEYDSGEVELDHILENEMESNYELNVVEAQEHEDVLQEAKILGDIPEEVEI